MCVTAIRTTVDKQIYSGMGAKCECECRISCPPSHPKRGQRSLWTSPQSASVWSECINLGGRESTRMIAREQERGLTRRCSIRLWCVLNASALLMVWCLRTLFATCKQAIERSEWRRFGDGASWCRRLLLRTRAEESTTIHGLNGVTLANFTSTAMAGVTRRRS